MKNKENKTSVPASVWEAIAGNDGEESHNEAVHEDSETAAAKTQDDTPDQDVAAPQEHTHRLKKSLRRASEKAKERKEEKKERKFEHQMQEKRNQKKLAKQQKYEEARRKYYESRRRGNKITLWIGYVMIAVTMVMLFIWAGQYFYQIQKPEAHGTVTVDIPANATGAEIGNMLEEKHVISNAFVFRTALAVKGDSKKLQAGHYKFDQGITVKEAIIELHKGGNDFATVTIPEGYTVSQIAEALKKADIKGADDFATEAASYGPLTYMYGPEPAQVKGEGFLFADTYDIPKDYTAKQLCDLMYDHTDKMLSPEIRREAAEKKMSLHDLMTIASMVEKEAKFREDQVPIASVILKRLEINMPLQIDATIQYALGKPKEHLSIADTRINSPYNTYRRTGLPPGPIGAPGMNAIKAVLAAKPGEYLYYVAKPDGHHIFTRTLDEHEVAVASVKG